MTIAAGSPMLASDVNNIVNALWSSEVTSNINKGDLFSYTDQAGFVSFALVGLNYPHPPLTKVFNTGDSVLGNQSFTYLQSEVVPPNYGDFPISGPLPGDPIRAPNAWTTAILDGNPANALNALANVAVAIANAVVVGSIVGVVVAHYRFLDPGWPADGAGAALYDAFYAQIAYRV